jgi:hypothetical protein
MMLSNRITANNLDAKPAIQQTSKTEKTIKVEIPTKLFDADALPFVFIGVSLISPTSLINYKRY